MHCNGKGRDRAKISLDGAESRIGPKNRCEILIKMEVQLVDLSNPRYTPFICHFASQTLKSSQIVLLNEQNRQHFPIYVRKVEIKLENKFTINNGIRKLISLLGNVSKVR